MANYQGMTEFNNVCACVRLWRRKRILSRLHVRFSILLLLGVVYLPLFYYRTISKNFVHPLNIFKKNFLLKNTESRKMPTTITKCLCFNCSPFFLRKFRWNFDLERLSLLYWPRTFYVAFRYSALPTLSWVALSRGRYVKGSPNADQNFYEPVSLAYIRKDLEYRCHKVELFFP